MICENVSRKRLSAAVYRGRRPFASVAPSKWRHPCCELGSYDAHLHPLFSPEGKTERAVAFRLRPIFRLTAPSRRPVLTLDEVDAGFFHPAGVCFDLRLLKGNRRVDVVDKHFVQRRDRKSTRLNSSHVKISYAVFCL